MLLHLPPMEGRPQCAVVFIVVHGITSTPLTRRLLET